MRRVLPFVILVLTVLAPNFSFPAVEEETVIPGKSLHTTNRQGDEMVFRINSLMMTKQVDGKKVGKDKVVDISIEKANGVYIATWDVVEISSVELANEVKRTYLHAHHYGTDTGSIKNIVVNEKVITFEVVRFYGELMVEIFRAGEPGSDVKIRAVGIRYIDKKHRRFLEEWVMTNDIKLPPKEVFGYPEKKPKKRH